MKTFLPVFLMLFLFFQCSKQEMSVTKSTKTPKVGYLHKPEMRHVKQMRMKDLNASYVTDLIRKFKDQVQLQNGNAEYMGA